MMLGCGKVTEETISQIGILCRLRNHAAQAPPNLQHDLQCKALGTSCHVVSAKVLGLNAEMCQAPQACLSMWLSHLIQHQQPGHG